MKTLTAFRPDFVVSLLHSNTDGVHPFFNPYRQRHIQSTMHDERLAKLLDELETYYKSGNAVDVTRASIPSTLASEIIRMGRFLIEDYEAANLVIRLHG
jgi:hypothetical protein